MVNQLNNMVHHCNRNITNILYASSKTFPEQDNDKIGKLVRMYYKDEKYGYISNRLYINKFKFPKFTGINTEDNLWWRIVRWDKTDPFRIIMIDQWNRLIVTTVDAMLRLRVHPEYTFHQDELHLPISIDWTSFNRVYENEKIYSIPIQDDTYIGLPVFTEYYEDILQSGQSVNELRVRNKPVSTEKVKEMLFAWNDKLSILPDYILKAFPFWFSRHDHSMVDTPLRAINTGVILRCDQGASGTSVVVEILEDGSYRWVCEDECFIYYLSDSTKVDIKEMNLYHSWMKNFSMVNNK